VRHRKNANRVWISPYFQRERWKKQEGQQEGKCAGAKFFYRAQQTSALNGGETIFRLKIARCRCASSRLLETPRKTSRGHHLTSQRGCRCISCTAAVPSTLVFYLYPPPPLAQYTPPSAYLFSLAESRFRSKDALFLRGICAIQVREDRKEGWERANDRFNVTLAKKGDRFRWYAKRDPCERTDWADETESLPNLTSPLIVGMHRDRSKCNSKRISISITKVLGFFTYSLSSICSLQNT